MEKRTISRSTAGHSPGSHRDPGASTPGEVAFRAFFHRSPLSSILYHVVRDRDGRIVDWVVEDVNEAGAAGIGLARGSMLGRTGTDLFGAEAMPFYLDTCREVIGSGLPRTVEVRCSATNRAYRSSIVPIDDERFAAVSADITDIQNERDGRAALAASEAMFRAAFEENPETAALDRAIFDEAGRFVDCEIRFANRVCRQRYLDGLPVDAIVGVRFFARWPQYRPLLFDHYARVSERGEAFRFETHASRADGEFWAETALYPFGDGFVHLGRDVTEQRRAELSRAESELAARTARAELAEAQRVAGVGSWTWNPVTDVRVWSDALFRIFGLDPTAGPPTALEQGPLWEPRSRDRLMAAVARCVSDGTPYEVPTEIVRPDGTVRHVIARGEAFAGPDGSRMLRGTVLDVTDLVEAQTALAESEARYRLLAENASDIVARLAADGTVEWLSESVRGVLGFEPGALVGRNVSELIAPEDRPALAAAAELMARGKSVTFRERFLKADGSRVWCETSARPVMGPTGRLVSRVGSTRVVQAQVEAEEKVSAALSALSEAQRIAHVGSWMFDFATRAATWSDAFLAIFGLEPGADLRSRFAEFLSPAVIAELRSHVEDIGRGRASYEFEHDVRRPDGSVRRVVSRGEAVRDASGAVTSLHGTLADVTELRAAQEQVAHAERSRLVGQLAGGIAHDFNNLLMAILTAADLVGDGLPPGSELAEDVDTIRTAGMKAAELTRQLLAYGRRQILVPANLDAGELVRGLLPLIRSTCGPATEVAVSVQEPAPVLRADRTLVEKSVLNLVLNAHEAMRAGGHLAIAIDRGDLGEGDPALRPPVLPGPFVRIAVRDTGHGILPEYLPHVFEPFFSTKDASEGAGLGLASVDGAMAQSGGFATIRSEPGRGTTVTLMLPAAVPGDPEHRLVALVVDDEEVVRHALVRVAGRAGLEVIAAAGPEEALAIATTPGCVIDVLLTDVVMPKMSGVELADRLTGLVPGLRVILTSAHPPEVVFARGAVPPGAVFLPKPFLREQLVEALASAERHRPTP